MKWDAQLYDHQHGFVSKYGEDLIGLLKPAPGEAILDIGCGTGDLANLIAASGAEVTGLDHSAEMVAAAREKYPGTRFDIGSASDFNFDMPFDAVFSNATLHWVLAYKGAVKCIYNALKPNGRFVAEFGGRGNVSNIIRALQTALRKRGYTVAADTLVWYFPSLSEYCFLLEQNGFRVVYATHFDRETLLQTADGIRNWIQMFGKSFLEGIDSDEVDAILSDVEENIRLANYKNGNWYADYVRLRLVAIKETDPVKHNHL